MTKRATIAHLISLTMIGSFVVFYFANFILSDVSNMFYGVHDVFFISSLPGAAMIADIVMFAIYLFRQYMRSQYVKKMTLLYLRLLVIFSTIGILSAIYAGAVIYDSFFEAYPFFAYPVIMIAVHIFLLVFAIVKYGKVKKNMPEDRAKRKINMSYVVYSTLLSILVLFAFDRFGAFIWGVVYVHWRTLYITFPFYLSLLMPMALLFHMAYYAFDIHKGDFTKPIRHILIVMVLNLILGIAVFCIGSQNTQFISAISPALAIERLATLPIDTVLQFLLVMLLGLYELNYSIKQNRLHGNK